MPSADEQLEGFLNDLLRTDTNVPSGETEVAPGDPKIVGAVERVIQPVLASLEPEEVRITDERDLLVRFGPAAPGGLLLQTYVVAQHANLATKSEQGVVPDGSPFGLEGAAGVGRGATQIKGPMASVFAAAAAIDPSELRRPLWVSVNTEGMSSHSGSERIFGLMDGKPDAAVIAVGTDLRVSLGNRGRVDLKVVAHGDSFHSSQPWLGRNAIALAAAALTELGTTPVPDEHPDLGPASITPYGLSCYPIAPHTLPSRVTITVDRRLLPGEDPHEATEAVAHHLATLEGIEVAAGAFMLPVKVSSAEPVVVALIEGLERSSDVTFYSSNAFDAGYAFSQGIPTVMFGPGRRHFAGEGLLGSDAVALADCRAATRALTHLVNAICKT